jgi:hypothetical protein
MLGGRESQRGSKAGNIEIEIEMEMEQGCVRRLVGYRRLGLEEEGSRRLAASAERSHA